MVCPALALTNNYYYYYYIALADRTGKRIYRQPKSPTFAILPVTKRQRQALSAYKNLLFICALFSPMGKFNFNTSFLFLCLAVGIFFPSLPTKISYWFLILSIPKSRVSACSFPTSSTEMALSLPHTVFAISAPSSSPSSSLKPRSCNLNSVSSTFSLNPFPSTTFSSARPWISSG